MRKKFLPVGTDDYEKVRTEGFYYVDKTDLIRELLNRHADVTLFTRPRRFGKSLNMSMLKWFFEIPEEALYRQEDTISGNLRAAEFQKSLFAGLSVSSDKELCDRYMGRYPVISISLKNVDGLDFEQAFNSLCAVIGMEADRFGFLAKSPELTEDERADYQKIVQRDASGKRRYAMTYDVLCGSLLTLSRLLQKHFGRKVIILVDEYDVPLDKAYLNGFYDEMASLIRTIFNASLKSNPALAFSVMTGCLRISKESIFTGLNNLKVDSITDRQFSEYFGFTEQEVSELLGYYRNPAGKAHSFRCGMRGGHAEIIDAFIGI
ncbi:MAG: AAA family ATPase [Bulleidia sp.]|nr:AAA family ATPase [Bulleidia sp.]